MHETTTQMKRYDLKTETIDLYLHDGAVGLPVL